MQMTIQEIKNAIKYNELNSVEIIKEVYESIKHTNEGILDVLGTDDIANLTMMLRYLAEKCELLRRRSNSFAECFAAFNLREEIFDVVDTYTTEQNNRIRKLLATK